jgi:HK97 family phage portal protein
MSFLSLVKNALRPMPAAHAAAKTSAAGPIIAWSHTGQPRWTPRRFEHLAEAGFRKNVIAYRCVMQVATAASAIPWLLYNDHNEEIDRHPLLDLLRHPNPLQDGVAFMESVYAYLAIAGNAYIEAVTPGDGDAPVELYVLRPDRMKVIPGPTGLPEGYQYTVNGRVTTWPADPVTGASNILHLRQFHPLDDWYGMAPLEAAQISVDQHNAAGSWNQALLNHGARPSGALVFAPKDGPSSLTDEQMQRLREELGQVYQGSSNAGRPLILEGGLDWREMSLSPKDMDWLAGRNTAARDIALAFGVPAQLVGIPDAQTYANMAEARMALYEETVLPLVGRVIAGFDHWLTPLFEDGLELDFDPDEVSALALRRDTQWNKLQTTDFLTINEKRHAVGYAPIAGGDVLDSANKKPTVSSPAFTGIPKFNPYHDPDNGQFTTGPGGDDDGDEDDQPAITLVSDTSTPFSRPAGVPEDWIQSPTKGPGGIQFTDPNNSGTYVRVMPGDPDSEFPNSQAPYVRWQMNGQALDANGDPLPTAKLPEAHIPLDEFEIPAEFFDLP